MKKVEAIIKPFKLDAVMAALTRLGVQGLTVSEVRGCGRQKGHIEHFRGADLQVDLLPKIKLEVAVADTAVGEVLSAILTAARTGQIGDGKVYVSHLREAVRIRTAETGQAAIFDATCAASADSRVECF